MFKTTTSLALHTWIYPRFWIILTGIVLLCFFSGPFGTFEALPSALRLFYWAAIVVTSGMLGAWGHALIIATGWQQKWQMASISALFGLCISAIVIFCSFALLDPIDRYPGPLELFLYSFPSSAFMFFVSVLMTSMKGSTPDQPINIKPELAPNLAIEKHITTLKRPALFERLQKYTDAKHIVALNAQDHYVEVVTDLGSELCLIRLNDAIAETTPTQGLQIHRSTWVALSSIERIEPNNGKPQVVLSNGLIYRVSQARLKELKALTLNRS